VTIRFGNSAAEAGALSEAARTVPVQGRSSARNELVVYVTAKSGSTPEGLAKDDAPGSDAIDRETSGLDGWFMQPVESDASWTAQKWTERLPPDPRLNDLAPAETGTT